MITYLIFAIDGIPTTNTRSGTGRAIVTPTGTLLSIGTISSHVTSITTNATNDVGSEVLFLWTIVFAMADLTAVLASLVLVITKSTVQRSELSKLVALEFVLSFGDRGSLEYHC